MKKKLMKILRQGSAVINQASLYAESENIVCLIIDMGTKWAEVSSYNHSNGISSISIDITENSLHIHKTKKGETEICFSAYKDWEIFTASCNRYTLSVCLIRKKE